MFIYVASPYTGAEQERYEATMKFVAKQTDHGHILYSPIIHFHAVAQEHNLPRDFFYWKDHIITMMRMSSCVWVLRLEGWEVSAGVSYEVGLAKYFRIRVKYVDP